ncbi:hypothetical protein CIB48_g1927 [Xylaria polymorpha]|nr:hypothetical protein CIB48_g1927 [Xylaria polymorpha]
MAWLAGSGTMDIAEPDICWSYCASHLEHLRRYHCVGFNGCYFRIDTICPLGGSDHADVGSHIATPRHTNPDWSNSDGLANSDYGLYLTLTTALGIFTFVPEFDLPGAVLDDARNSIDKDRNITQHAKLDKSGYVYITRSFGAAAVAGLRDFFPTPAVSYSYIETGLKISTLCTRNLSSNLQLDKLSTPPGWNSDLIVYNATGTFPNGATTSNIAASVEDYEVFMMGAAFGSPSSDQAITHYAGMTSIVNENETSGYSALFKIQCQILYDPQDFLVSVNVTNRTIAVIPKPKHNRDSQLRLAHLHTSVLGDTFMKNIVTLTNFTLGDYPALDVFLGVETALNAMLDDFLVANSAAQLMALNSSRLVNAKVLSNGYVFGDPKYIYAVLALSLAVTIVVLVEAGRTRLWKDAPKFDFTDVIEVIEAASLGGNGIASAMNELRDKGGESKPTGTTLSKVRIALAEDDDGNSRLIVAARAISNASEMAS